jgi:hypothetical protein
LSAKFSEKIVKVAQEVSYLNENIFDFFFAVKKFYRSSLEVGRGRRLHGPLPCYGF